MKEEPRGFRESLKGVGGWKCACADLTRLPISNGKRSHIPRYGNSHILRRSPSWPSQAPRLCRRGSCLLLFGGGIRCCPRRRAVGEFFVSVERGRRGASWGKVLTLGLMEVRYWMRIEGRTPPEYAPFPWSPIGPSRTISPSV